LIVALAISLVSPVDGAWVPDLWLTTRTKIALLTTEDLDASSVDVDVVDGQVSLHGTVPADVSRSRAEQVARSVPGVREVRNLLQVVAPERKAALAASDGRIRRRVEKALASEKRLEGSKIRIGSVHGGLVLLSGEARNDSEHLLAIRLARSVPGVRAVATEVRISDADASMALLDRHELREGGRGVADLVSDLWITTETKLALLADPRLGEVDVNVDTRDGVVTLFGTVASPAEKRAAADDARRVEGVRRVEDKIQVVPAARRKDVAIRDDDVRTRVEKAIYDREELRHTVIRVEVKNGVVRLTGIVPTLHHRLVAPRIARGVRGVRAVEEELEVRTMVEKSGAAAPPGGDAPARR
jgi:osmotically-inducible protein OsmY